MADNKYESLKIENIVATGVIADSIDLMEVSKKVKNCELNTKRFPGAVYRIEKPKIASLIFSSGKVVLTSIRDKQALIDGLNIILKSLKSAGVKIHKEPKIVALLFASGKIILTGGKNLEDIKKGLDFLEQKLESIM